jgi:aminoglycoside phosphotransferase (APT) family kinase protein
MSSEVVIMRYLTAHTSIPVPRVIHYCIDADSGGVGSPYMILAKVDGVPLSSVWDDMGDAKREIVLREIVDILLELASHRFDKIGTIKRQHQRRVVRCTDS